ncbi:MAG TPA: ferritin-like domain-containing protein, partial [Chthoniobacterales bacterium]|nr:ferritin-like domain-containing protein [Chthoniobacterales bacterium]
MKEQYLSGNSPAQTHPAAASIQNKDANPFQTVPRRSFIKGLGVVGATLLPGAALLKAQSTSLSGKLSKGDADLLRFALWAELVESDLWTQYNELGGATAPNDGPANTGNPPYKLALQNLDGDMPQYITDNNDDELSHAAFLDAYLRAHGAESVDLDPYRILQGSTATGVDKTKIGKRLTNLLSLNVDLSWYTRYRSGQNPDLGASIKGPFTISNEPAIPLNDTDTPPTVVVPAPPIPAGSPAQRIQAIANTAGFHFAFIEQGGTSLYPTLALKATSEEVLRILLSIGGVEIDHFSLWHDKAGNAVAQPLAGVTDPKTHLNFPDLNDPATLARLHLELELTQTNKIQPEPCAFLETHGLPACSIIRPTSTELGGAVATVKSFVADGLFNGLPDGFFQLSMQLATAADN